MAFNAFIGWSREDLENELRAAQEDYAAGKASIKAGAGDVSSESRIEASSKKRIEELYKALNAIAPEDYPIGQITAIDRTRGAFWGNDPVWPWP